MKNSIKELIELSTSNGSIKQESRDFIYQKAEKKGVSKTECDIYIENALNVTSKQEQDSIIEKSYSTAERYIEKSHSMSRIYIGWGLIMGGIIDFVWGVVVVLDIYVQGAVACMITGAREGYI